MRTIKFHKTECGVDGLLRVGAGSEIAEGFEDTGVYNTDYFDILFSKKAKGNVVLNQRKSLSLTISFFYFPPSKKDNGNWILMMWISLFSFFRKIS